MTGGAACDPAELKTLFLFQHLQPDQLMWLCENGRVTTLPPGMVFTEGEPATCFYVLISGEVVLYSRVGNDDIEVTRSSQRGVYSGAWRAYLGEAVAQTYTNSMRIPVESRFFMLDAEKFRQLMHDWFPMPLHLLEGLFFGMQARQEVIGQRERLVALGALSAGLTHELNNPAAAAVRATSALRDRVAGMRQKLRMIASGPWDRVTLEKLVRWQEDAVEHVAKAPVLSPMEAADREDALTDWFSEHGISESWSIAPNFVQAGIDEDWLNRFADDAPEQAMEGAMRWLNYTLETELLMNEIEDSTTRVSTLVGAAKQYSQLDRAPQQVVDVHDLLESTLVMLSHKIGPGVKVVRDYDRGLPRITAYGAELNQVWTNLIDNAVAAMDGAGTLTIRTALDHDQLLVEIGDDGPGIPAELQNRVFEPFFTTKPVGVGTGLGLDISYRIVVNKHHGDLRVNSRPGDTRFQVRLPLAFTGRLPTTDDPADADSTDA